MEKKYYGTHTLMTLIVPNSDKVLTVWRDNNRGTHVVLHEFSLAEVMSILQITNILSDIVSLVSNEDIRRWCNQWVINNVSFPK